MKKLIFILLVLFPVFGVAQSKVPAFNFGGKIIQGVGNEKRLGTGGKDGMGMGMGLGMGPGEKWGVTGTGGFIQIFDSIDRWGLNTVNNEWNIGGKTIDMVYDGKNNLASQLEIVRNGSGWGDSIQDIYTYDAYHDRTIRMDQVWNGGAWRNGTQDLYTYDANNNLTDRLYQEWTGPGWNNVDAYTYTYDSRNNLTSELYQMWENPGWTNYEQYFYTYDSNNNQIMETDQGWNDFNGWVNSNQYISTYNANNFLIRRLVNSWDSAWVNYEKDTLIYDSNNDLTSSTEQKWVDGAWVNYYQYTYSYDSSHNPISELCQSWWNGGWVNSWQQFSTYDVHHFVESFSYRYFDVTGSQVSFGDSLYYYFRTAVGIDDLKLQGSGLSIYPNPAEDKCEMRNAKCDIKKIEIFNLCGEKVYGAEFPAGGGDAVEVKLDFPAGVYFVRVTGDKMVEVGKIIKD